MVYCMMTGIAVAIGQTVTAELGTGPEQEEAQVMVVKAELVKLLKHADQGPVNVTLPKEPLITDILMLLTGHSVTKRLQQMS